MQGAIGLTRRLGRVFDKEQVELLVEMYDGSIRASDFNELKGIVRELADAQKRSENRLERVEAAIEKLAIESKGMMTAIEKLAIEAKGTRQELGGLSRSVSYALENEAYKMLPAYTKERYGLEITKRFIRTEVRGEEINLFARGRRNGQDVIIVGESVLRLVDTDELDRLEQKVSAVKKEYKEEVIKLIITHYAKPKVLKEAEEEKIIIVQSFEW